MLDSFDEWYAGQFHYKKINGDVPSTKWSTTTMLVLEVAEKLGIAEATLYDLMKK